jgi:tetraacyldisaccharide 4'-kinase
MEPVLKSFRLLLLPISLLYWVVVRLRNLLYDRDYLKSSTFNFPLIGIGNLAVGGTGKTPMTEYLVRLLKDQYRVATLSRGYKRKTTGFGLAGSGTTALEIGDEPMLFHQKFPDIAVAVGEERLVAIPQLLHDRPETQAILLDDVLQHRQVNPGLKILLTEYSNLYTRDFMLPAGDLRDVRHSARRADCLVVTKCPPDLTLEKAASIRKELRPRMHQQVFFTCLEYGAIYRLGNPALQKGLTSDLNVLLVSGIANPKPLRQLLTLQAASYEWMGYPDHHIFTMDDLAEIKKQFAAMPSPAIVLTTEKDAVRLEKFQGDLAELPLYVIPVQPRFLWDEDRFQEQVLRFVASFAPVNV